MHHDVPSRAATPEAAPVAARAPAERRRQITLGVRDSFSAGLGIFPLGIALGLLIMQAGLPWWLAPALSLAAFAGSLELLLVGMMATVTPLAAVALTVLVVNFRHVFYAFSFPLHLVKHPVAKAYAVYAMIDEAYAVNASLPEAERSAPRLLAMQFACETYWVGGGLVGSLSAPRCPRRSRAWSSPCAPCSPCSPWTRSAPAASSPPSCSPVPAPRSRSY
ncbi:AzlC family ABC transporter permease [Streptomyces mirabilis]|uniref:AzlC family ABC transporter permease n=1 Tax=Streptomyces mirabilis TaxID=68239 RepID=UPI0021BEDE13|nr:AzlC family ABC transporter permease [Streptomyces mirabilis]MCT9104849.1 AzlC family ABC transporter permease [Streptomyces mirabilis]